VFAVTVQGLLGPNGAGKRTSVRILGTLITPDRGRARNSGADVQKDPNTVRSLADVQKDPNTVRSLIGLAGQYSAVDETLTGRENLIMAGQLCGLGTKRAQVRADGSLEKCRLEDAGGRAFSLNLGRS
jgi:ABC-type multidrug transport system ATPase subunit